jgi:hypothetical protein
MTVMVMRNMEEEYRTSSGMELGDGIDSIYLASNCTNIPSALVCISFEVGLDRLAYIL